MTYYLHFRQEYFNTINLNNIVFLVSADHYIDT